MLHRLARTALCLGAAGLLASCLAGFDSKVYDFTEGPNVFVLDSGDLGVPEDMMLTDGGSCALASVECADPLCPEETGGCDIDGLCRIVSHVVLDDVIDTSDAYSASSLRVQQVDVQAIDLALEANDLAVDIAEMRLSWAPSESVFRKTLPLTGSLGIGPDDEPGPLDVTVDPDGVRALEEHLQDEPGFRVFVEFETSLEPGAPCPEGSLDLELSMRFVVTGEPVG